MALPSHEPWAQGYIVRLAGRSSLTVRAYRLNMANLRQYMVPGNFKILCDELDAAEVANRAIENMMKQTPNVLDAGATED